MVFHSDSISPWAISKPNLVTSFLHSGENYSVTSLWSSQVLLIWTGTHVILIDPQQSSSILHSKIWMHDPVNAVVHKVRDVLPSSFGIWDMSGHSLQSIDPSAARRSFSVQVQMSFPGPCGQLLQNGALLVEWSLRDPCYQEPIDILYTKGIHFQMWHLYPPFLPMPCHTPRANLRHLGQIRSHPGSGIYWFWLQVWLSVLRSDDNLFSSWLEQ